MRFGLKSRLYPNGFAGVVFVALLSISIGACVSTTSPADSKSFPAIYGHQIESNCVQNDQSFGINSIGAMLFNFNRRSVSKNKNKEDLISGRLVPFFRTSLGKEFSLIPANTKKYDEKWSPDIRKFRTLDFTKSREADGYKFLRERKLRSSPRYDESNPDINLIRTLSIGEIVDSPYLIRRKLPFGIFNKWIVVEKEGEIIGYTAFNYSNRSPYVEKIFRFDKWVPDCEKNISETKNIIKKHLSRYPTFSAKLNSKTNQAFPFDGDAFLFFDFTPKLRNSPTMADLIRQLYELMENHPKNVKFYSGSVNGLRIQPDGRTLNKEIRIGKSDQPDAADTTKPATSKEADEAMDGRKSSKRAIDNTHKLSMDSPIFELPNVTAKVVGDVKKGKEVECTGNVLSAVLSDSWCEIILENNLKGYVFRGFEKIIPEKYKLRDGSISGAPVNFEDEFSAELFVVKDKPGWFKFTRNVLGKYGAVEKQYFAYFESLIGFEHEEISTKERLMWTTSQFPQPSFGTVLPTNQPPQGDTEIVAFKAPPSLSDRDRRNEFRIEGCETKEFLRGGYLMRCDLLTPKIFRMGNFQPTELIMIPERDGFRRNKFTIRIEPGTITGPFYASISAGVAGQYRYGESPLHTSKDPNSDGRRLAVFTRPLEDFRERVVLKGKSGSKCDISIQFDINNMSSNSAFNANSSCQFVSVSFPSSLGSPNVVGCANPRKSRGGFTCSHSGKKNFTVDWGKGWKRLTLPPRQSLAINLGHIRAIWPFSAKEPWLDPKRVSSDPCNGVPTYAPTSVTYCAMDGKCASGKVSRKKGRIVMPSLKQSGWGNSDGLPKTIGVTLRLTSKTPDFQKNISVSWNAEAPPNKLQTLMTSANEKREILPVRVNTFDEVPPNMNAKFLVFDSLKECKASTKSKNWQPYHENFVRELTAHRCSYAKVTHGSKNVTPCVAPKRQKNKWVFSMYTEKYKGARQIILIANSKRLRQKGKKAVEGLIEWLADLKEKKTKKPITLMSVDGDGRIRTLLRAEELKNLAVSVNDPSATAASIRGRVKARLSFTGSGFRPLDNLIDLEGKMGSDIGRVLFVTDEGFPKDADVPPRDLGTPLVWKDRKIDFAVLTTSRCGFWEKRARAKKCEHLGANPARQTRKLLNGFF